MAKQDSSGTLYMIPIPIAENALHTLAPEVITVTSGLKYYFVENIRTARRFLRALHATLVIDDLQFSEIDKHNGADAPLLKKWLAAGYSVGVLSEAGCPGIADPGAELAAVAQNMGINVVPLTGPNSMILALMASGLNGQSFSFTGYLPVKEPMRGQRIKELEARSAKERQTQLFIETPYRNDQLLTDLLKNCQPKTRICIAKNVTAPDALIQTKTAADWLRSKPVLGKTPAVFLVLA